MSTFNFPTNEELAVAAEIIARQAKAYGFAGDANDVVNLLCRAAKVLAPAVAESALDSGNTDVRPEVVGAGRKADAWDLVAIAHVFNALAV